MPRLDDEDDSLGEATSCSSSTSASSSPVVLAYPTNRTANGLPLDENNDTPQGQKAKDQLSARQEHVTSSSTAATAANSSLSDSLPVDLPRASPLEPDLTPEKLAEEVAKLTRVIESAPSQAAGKALHTFWRKFLFGENSGNHLCWVLRAGIKNAPPTVLERLLRDRTMLNVLVPVVSKQEDVIKTVLDDATHDQLLSHIPNDLLDQEICKRLKTIPAKPLIRWLAEAKRLGFQEDDILDDEDEIAVPSLATIEANLPTSFVPGSNLATPVVTDTTNHESGSDVEMADVALNVGSVGRDSPHEVQEQQQQQHALAIAPNGIKNIPLMCPLCHFEFSNNSGYNYHLAKKICSKQPPPHKYKSSCQNCGQSFTTKQGGIYHAMNSVCLDQDTAPATSPLTQAPTQRTASGPINPQHKPGDPILPPPRQTFASHQGQNGTPQPRQPRRRPSTNNSIPRPPLQNPVLSQSLPSGTPISPLVGSPETTSYQPRQSPAELDLHSLARLNKALADQELKYHTRCVELDPGLKPSERAAKLQTLKKSHASTKSQIRKSFNVTLRMGEKDKAARDAAMVTPIAKPDLQGYRANSDSGPHVSEMAPAQSLSLNAAPPRVLPINPPHSTGYDRKGSKSISHGSIASHSPPNGLTPVAGNSVGGSQPDTTSSIGVHSPHANKRQRTNHNDLQTYSTPYGPVPSLPRVQSLAGTGDQSSQNYGSTEAHKPDIGRAEVIKPPTQATLVGTGDLTQPFEVLTSSEDDTGDESIPSLAVRTAQQGATIKPTEQASVEKRRSEGPARGTFTAKRGKPYLRK